MRTINYQCRVLRRKLSPASKFIHTTESRLFFGKVLSFHSFILLIVTIKRRFLKSTVGNITMIDRFRKKNEDAEKSPEEQIFQFWMDYFVEATKTEVGDTIRFPVSFFFAFNFYIFFFYLSCQLCFHWPVMVKPKVWFQEPLLRSCLSLIQIQNLMHSLSILNLHRFFALAFHHFAIAQMIQYLVQKSFEKSNISSFSWYYLSVSFIKILFPDSYFRAHQNLHAKLRNSESRSWSEKYSNVESLYSVNEGPMSTSSWLALHWKPN